MSSYDAVVVGAGPNGLAAAIRIAAAGMRVLVLEAGDRPGGGSRSAALTLPGFVHDVCSAVHPLGAGSPFFASLPLRRHGLEWVHPDVPLAHPLDGDTAVLSRSLAATAAGLGEEGLAWRRLFGPLVRDWPVLRRDVLGPALRMPRHPLLLARFGLRAVLPATVLTRGQLTGPRSAALFAGLAAHGLMRLDRPPSAAFGLLLGLLGHAVGWPFPRGGAQALSDALAAHLAERGGRIVTGRRVTALAALPPSRVVLLDTTPQQAVRIAGGLLSPLLRARLRRYRHGPGVFKVDYALDGPVPWRDPAVSRAGTVHVGGTAEEIAAAEAEVAAGRHPQRPFVLVAQPSTFDVTRAPAGGHTLWAYCHVPNGSAVDMTGRLEAQIERFAPGFRDRVTARHTLDTAGLEAYNAAYPGGDISGGAHDRLQAVVRPRLSPHPYRLRRPDGDGPGIYLCSAATPPGAGVHGMCGFHAAGTALADLTVLRGRGPAAPRG